MPARTGAGQSSSAGDTGPKEPDGLMIAWHSDHRPPQARPRAPQEPDVGSPAGRMTTAGAHPLLRLQRMAGNRATQRAVRQHRASPDAPASGSSATLRVGPADDRNERDADRAAEQITRGRVPGPARTARHAPGADPGGVVVPEVQRDIAQIARSGGRPIPEPVRVSMEQAIGAEFDQVRVHTGQRADDVTRSLHARAFTTGRDIFFRRGQYEPSSPAGQRVLAHELTHVVQQAAAGPSGSTPLVQRLIGFEFETDWGIHGIKNPVKQGTSKKPSKHTAYKYKDEDTGFTVQVDEAHRGFNAGYEGLSRQIEFVVEPHEETDQGAARLLKTMRSLKAEAAELDNLRTNRKGDEKGFKYPGTNPNLWVFPDAKTTAAPKIHARAQATVGLTLPAISTFALLPTGQPAKTRTGGFLVTHARKEASLRGHKDPLTLSATAASQIKGASEDLRGLVSLLALYIKVFHEPLAQKEDYVKGYLPLLAKTDFGAMFGHLPAKEQKKYGKTKSNRKDFAKLVLGCVTADQTYQAVTKNMPVIPDTQMPGDTPLNLTLADWLSSIAGGQDKLTKRHDPRLFGLGDLGEGVNEGQKTDPPPDAGSPRMVVEFRGGSVGIGPGGAQGFLTPDEWIEFAFDYFNLVRQVHGYELEPEWEEFQPKPPPESKAKVKSSKKSKKKKVTKPPPTRSTLSGSESS
jgi:hypothetical protein